MILHLGGNAKHVTGSNYSVVTSASYQPSSRAKRAIIRRLAAAGASLDLPTIYGESPLSVCLYFGDLESLRLLIELGADPGPLDWTALHKCVALGGVSHIQALNPDSTEINRLNSRFQLSPWLLAFVRGDQQIVDWLAERGADLDQASHTGGSLCHLAARFGHVEILRWLESRSADPNAQDSFASSPLHEAAAWDHVDCASALIEFGAEVASEDHVQSQAIHGARSIRMLEVLCQAGADINAVSGTGEWPLQFAAEDNDVERLKWLLNNGAAVDQNSTGATALHTAVQRDSREAVNLLLRAGANPNQEDVDGQTPLFMAQSVETIKALLIAGADRKISDQAGRFPKGCLTDPLLKRALKHL
ncbi:MAG TPA: ankyrin repeat domain-containing protein [Methylomirabilota bacterium]|nr:ankyrin repeat domain-containing protein [Methylomirabilota bacterium]